MVLTQEEAIPWSGRLPDHVLMEESLSRRQGHDNRRKGIEKNHTVAGVFRSVARVGENGAPAAETPGNPTFRSPGCMPFRGWPHPAQTDRLPAVRTGHCVPKTLDLPKSANIFTSLHLSLSLFRARSLLLDVFPRPRPTQFCRHGREMDNREVRWIDTVTH